MNIYQKLIEVRKVVPYLQKAETGQQYKYVSSSQVLASVRQKMDELNLLLIPKVVAHQVTSKEKQTSKGSLTTEYFTELDMEFIWVNADEPNETIMIPWYGQGIDTAGEKGVGKALTYAEKYFLLKQFNIATDKDDPDRFQEQHKGPEKVVDLASKVHKDTVAKLVRSTGIEKTAFNHLLSDLHIDDYKALTKEQAELLIKELSAYKKPVEEPVANAQ